MVLQRAHIQNAVEKRRRNTDNRWRERDRGDADAGDDAPSPSDGRGNLDLFICDLLSVWGAALLRRTSMLGCYADNAANEPAAACLVLSVSLSLSLSTVEATGTLRTVNATVDRMGWGDGSWRWGRAS
mmetsp:Transcript_36649/g.80176  ORF Transcript_36649/g.80176 Transcript_36649/m.80176 type:complete len:128 (+) Transcript_36649:223-606(+)